MAEIGRGRLYTAFPTVGIYTHPEGGVFCLENRHEKGTWAYTLVPIIVPSCSQNCSTGRTPHTLPALLAAPFLSGDCAASPLQPPPQEWLNWSVMTEEETVCMLV